MGYNPFWLSPGNSILTPYPAICPPHFQFLWSTIVGHVLDRVDATGSLFEHERVDVSASGDVIAWSVRPITADVAMARPCLWDVTFPLRWIAAVISDVGFQLEPARFRGRAVHVNIEQPVMCAVPLTPTTSTFLWTQQKRASNCSMQCSVPPLPSVTEWIYDLMK